ncbi:MAG: hypothetical protein RLZZ127_474 [Planctomycetota bacterium]|jgi:hypothetical protein
MAQDSSFKRLLQDHPRDTLAALAPDLETLLGVPADAQPIATEALPLGLAQRSRFMDVAIRYQWSSGHQAVILLVEHWSRTRSMDLRRAAHYATDLLLRHPDAAVLPIMVLCDADARTTADDRLTITVAHHPILDFRVRLIRIQSDLPPRLPGCTNPVLIVLSALLQDLPPVDRALRSLRLAVAISSKNAARWLVLIEDFATVAADETRRSLLHDRLRKDRHMASVIDMFHAEGKAEGHAESIVQFARDGLIPRTVAAQRLRHLHDQGAIPADLLAKALAELG